MDGSTSELTLLLDQICKEKNINKKIIIEALESSILAAAKKSFGMQRDMEARFNDKTGSIDLYQYLKIVEDVENEFQEINIEEATKYGLDARIGEQFGFQIFYREEDMDKAKKQDEKFGKLLKLKTYKKGFGRIAAQVAKHVIMQKVRDAEKDNIFEEFKDRKGELIKGVVRRFEKGDIIIDLGKTEAVLPGKEQVQSEYYRPGDSIVAYLKDIDKDSKGPIIILSRKDINLVVKLFETTVPEIYEGIVRIVSAAREAGVRSKIAVTTRDLDVDPIGACVGMKGNRVQTIVQDLKGEKIDIVPWDREPAKFVCNAIAPAEVLRVIIDENNGSMEIVVPDDKLSLAIGKKGQNVRLASQLTGWKLDIISETRYKQMEQEVISSLSSIEGVDDQMAHSLYKLGFRSAEELMEAEINELAAIPDIGGKESADRIQKNAIRAIETKYKNELLELFKRGNIKERERMKFIRNIGEKTIDVLEQSGYDSVENIAHADEDDLAVKTGLGLRRARQLKDGAVEYLKREQEIKKLITANAKP